MEEDKQICPWCQTEIVWDPEIGPEDECPHCFNELGEYRSVTVDLDTDEDAAAERAAEAYEEDGARSERYREKVASCLDTQTLAPECSNCGELMLLAGVRTVEQKEFKAVTPAALGRPFLRAPFFLNTYVCPACFRTDTMLSQSDRHAMIDAIKDS